MVSLLIYVKQIWILRQKNNQEVSKAYYKQTSSLYLKIQTFNLFS